MTGVQTCALPISLADARCAGSRKPSTETIGALYDWVDGWAAGFVCLLGGLGEGNLSRGSPPWRSERLLFDYLDAEVFERLESVEQDFLCRISILPSVTPEAAEAIIGTSDVAAVLEPMARRLGTFIREVPPSTPTYTLSPVFRAFLSERLRNTTAPDALGALARTAADFLSGIGRVDEAVAVLAGHAEWAALGALIFREAHRRLLKGEAESVLAWLQSVPPGVLEQDPNLCYCMGGAKTPVDFAESLRWFERAYALFSDRRDRIGMLNAWSAIVETIFFEWGDFSKLRHWISAGERLLQDDTDIPAEGAVGQRAASAMFNALMHSWPDHPEIGVWAQRMWKILREIDDDSERLLLGAALFIYYTKWLGEHFRAEIVLEMLCPPPERLPQLSSMARILLAILKCTYHWNRYELEAADGAIQDGIETAQRSGIQTWDFLLHAQPVYAGLRDRKSTRLNSSHIPLSRMPSSA